MTLSVREKDEDKGVTDARTRRVKNRIHVSCDASKSQFLGCMDKQISIECIMVNFQEYFYSSALKYVHTRLEWS